MSAKSSSATNAERAGLRVTVYNEVDGRITDLLFNQFPVRVGRNAMNDLVLNHPYISQWHALIDVVEGKVTVTQVGSSNSIWVGEQKLKPNEEVQLENSASVRIMPFTLHIQQMLVPQELRQTPPPLAGRHLISPESATEQSETLLERTALKALERMSTRFLGRDFKTTQEIADFASRLEATLAVFFRFFIALQRGQDQFRQALDIKALERDGLNTVARSLEVTELAVLLLGPDNNQAITELEHAFKDIMLHQVALIHGLMAGVRTLLAKLSPKAITKAAGTGRRSPNLRSVWDTYQEIHRDLSEEDNETFETLFGPQFAKAYANLVGKKISNIKKS